jgi:hypothetical protein
MSGDISGCHEWGCYWHPRGKGKMCKQVPTIQNHMAQNITMGLDFEHKIKARAHKGGVRIGKTPKKLASICCP